MDKLTTALLAAAGCFIGGVLYDWWKKKHAPPKEDPAVRELRRWRADLKHWDYWRNR